VSKPFIPSPQQEAIFADVGSGEGHTVVLALAGTGKSTTILKSLDHLPPEAANDTLLVAFNKNIAKHLEGQAPPGVKVQTLHGYGLRQISGAIYPRPTIDDEKMHKILGELIPDRVREARGPARKLVDLAKGCLASKAESVDAIIDAYEVNVPDVLEREQFIAYALEAMDRSLDDQTTVDFNDMIWFPCKLKMTTQSYARVFVDETQDLNAAQIKLALKACDPNGRICAVGDKNQAIYQFRGADHQAIDNVIRKLSAKTLGLTTTYRCAKSIVRLAQTIVPEFEAAPGAPEGIVRDADVNHLLAKAEPGDFVLSRSNAPLVRVCLRFIREGKRVAIQGRDIGARLRAVIVRANKRAAGDVMVMLSEVERWKQKEIDRLTKLERDATNVTDTAGCIEAISEDASTVEEILQRIDRIFEDNGAGDKGKIVLSSTHKAKGLERDRVWLLANTYMQGRRYRAENGWEYDPPGVAERNLWYVAISRAQRELVLIRGSLGEE
jgi:DNA helicase II / ATP-dependent DNA helicase PcrA